MIRWITFTLVLVSFLETQAFQEHRDSVLSRRVTGIAMEKFTNKEYDSAEMYFDLAVKLDQKNWLAYRQRGVLELAQDDNSGALVDFTLALNINTKDTISYKRRADAKRFMRDAKGAIVDYNIAIRLDKNDFDMYIGRALAEGGIHDYTAAVLDLNACLKFKGVPNVVLAQRGMMHYYLANYNDAVKDLRKYFDRGGELKQYYWHLAHSYLIEHTKVNHYADSALIFFRRYQTSLPDSIHANEMVAAAYDATGDSVSARYYFQRALKFDSTNFSAYYMWGAVEIGHSQYKKAAELLTRAASIISTEPSTYWQLAVAKWELHDTIAAESAYKKIFELDSNYIDGYASRVQFHFGNPKYDQWTLKDLTKLIKLDPRRQSLFKAAIGLLYNRAGNRVAAKSEIDQAIRLSPINPTLFIVRGFIWNCNNESEAAVKNEYDLALRLNNNFKEAILMKAFLAKQSGNLKQSRKLYNEALKLQAAVSGEIKAYLTESKPLNDVRKTELESVLLPVLMEDIIHPER